MSKAYIIGTGPGDEELLTLKAVRVLKKCTAVMYDRLGASNILNHINDDCLVYYCGKKPGAHSMKQEEINELLVKLVKEGHTVGRIKGGDPYVFGRGGEEVLSLRKEGLDFEVVPGVTSPISVLNYAGIPITHRGIAQSFHIVTGMSAKSLNVDFEALSKENGTLVFMMGLENLEFIRDSLIKNGKDKNTKSAVVMKGTSSKQKKVVATLENIVEKVKEAKLESPCIICVGEVVSLNEDLDWYENKPLFGKNICITRSKKQSKSLKEKLWDLGAEVTEINTIKIEKNLEELNKLKDLDKYTQILFTSANGVDIFFDYLISKEIDLRSIKASISVIGNGTKKALIKRGIFPNVVSKRFIQEGLFEAVNDIIKPTDKVLLPTSKKARNYLKEEIETLGCKVDRVDIYDTVSGSFYQNDRFNEVDYILFTSPTTVINLIEMVGLESIKEKNIIAIGPQTARELKKNNIKPIVCKKHSEDGFIEEIKDIIK